MPSALTITMTGDPEKRHGPYLASLMQGVIMDRVDPAYARYLHESSIHPYSQYVEENESGVLWHIHALTREAEEELLGPLRDNSFTGVELLHRQETLVVKDKVYGDRHHKQAFDGKTCRLSAFSYVHKPI